jgi:putative hemolysin
MIDADEGNGSLKQKLITANHTCLPAFDNDRDNVIGVVTLRDIIEPMLAGSKIAVRQYVRTAPVILDTLDALAALKVLRKADLPLALVHDEYGHFEGLLTPADILDAIEVLSGRTKIRPNQKLFGAMTVHGRTSGYFSTRDPPLRNSCRVCARPSGTNSANRRSIAYQGWRFEVVDLDHRRVDKVLASRLES